MLCSNSVRGWGKVTLSSSKMRESNSVFTSEYSFFDLTLFGEGRGGSNEKNQGKIKQ